MLFTFLFFLFGLIVFFGIIISISKVQLKRSKRILENLSDQSLTKIRIKFLQNQTGKFTAVGGMNINAELYFNEKFILITPKVNGIFNGLNNFNLPLIFTRNVNEIQNLTGHWNVIDPKEFKVTDFKTVIIKYENFSIGKIKYSITIRPADKNDWYKLESLKNVC